jgi:hypothetical protein
MVEYSYSAVRLTESFSCTSTILTAKQATLMCASKTPLGLSLHFESIEATVADPVEAIGLAKRMNANTWDLDRSRTRPWDI